MNIVLLILVVDLGLLILWGILKSYWSHKETMEIWSNKPTSLLNTEDYKSMLEMPDNV